VKLGPRPVATCERNRLRKNEGKKRKKTKREM
jgi:hypothetical protein